MTSDIQMHYAATGSGRPLCLIHAFPMDHTMWNAQTAVLGNSHTVWAPDLPGFGQSSPSPGWRFETVAESILSTADSNGFDRFGVMGLSMGTYTAFEIHRQAPGRVSFLVLANGRARADSAIERESRSKLIAAVRDRGLVALRDTILPRLLGDNPSPAFADRLQNALDAGTVEGIVDAVEALRERRDSTGELAHIECPTLVLAGDSDPITPAAECQAMAEAIPGARFREIPNAGHLSNLENPDAFNASITQFLNSIGE